MGRTSRQRGYRSRRRGLLKTIASAFRERQIYLRSEGEVQFITLRPWVQVTGLALLLGGLFWLAFSTINMVFKDQLLALNERGMYDARLEYEDRIADLRRQVDSLNDRLMIDQGEYLSKVDVVRSEFERLVDRHKRLVEFFRQSLARRPATGLDVKQLEGTMPEKPTEEEPSDAHDNTGLETAPGKTDIDQAPFPLRYASEFRLKSEAERPLADMRAAYDRYGRMEVALLDEALEDASADAARIRKIFSRLGINDKKVVANSDFEREGVGGPFVPAFGTSPEEKDLGDRMARVYDTYASFDAMTFEAMELPLFLPMREIRRVSSGFGLRRDPFRKSMAMHAGIDFKADMSTNVFATAGGVVRRAGLEGGYGQMVEILHDNGVSTRYAHLSAVKVAVGQRVDRGDLVGKLGNTGRSTGPHLHYETRVNGKAVDPVRFWQTRHALQELAQEE